jgi:glyoxylase-like metal-dependent hydrolase (beta-lactamase superfamily II)
LEITKNVHLIEGTKGSFAYLILGPEPVLIDTSMPGRSDAMFSALHDIGVFPSDIAHILLTHHDVDHIGNARQIQLKSGAAVWAAAADVPYILGDKRPSGVRRVIRALMKYQTPVIDHTYSSGQTIGDIEVIPAPGHTPGHVCFRYKDVLLAGDLVTSRKNKLHPAPPFLTWDKTELSKSLKEVGKLTYDWVCPAHGLPIRRGNLWDALI